MVGGIRIYITFREGETEQGNTEKFYTLTEKGEALILTWQDDKSCNDCDV
jgi:DNA-binding PadR family transcriptional regulator